MRFIFLLYVVLVYSSLLSQSTYSYPLAAEDGSEVVKSWYISQPPYQSEVMEGIRAGLQSEGVNLKFFPQNNIHYLQDVAHFDAKGGLLLLAPMSPNELEGLTMAVLNNEDGFWDLLRIDQYDGKKRQLKWTFLEGGGVISGRFSNGEPYVILREIEFQNSKKYLEGLSLPNDRQSVVEKMAEDLEIKPENLFILPYYNHIDLIITALPHGKLLIQDPRLNHGVINSALQGKFGEISKTEAKELKSMLAIHKDGFYKNEFGRVEELYSSYSTAAEILDRITGILSSSKKFQIKRVAGRFSKLVPYANRKDLYVLMDRINFFNGFIGRSPKDNQLFVLTNKSEVPILHNYWRQLLYQEARVSPERTYFVGHYSSGAGLDCIGAIGGSE